MYAPLLLALVLLLVFLRPRKTIFDAYKSMVMERFPDLPDTTEWSERMAVMNHLPKGRVLEIGGNVGGVSSMIHALGRDLVVVEPSKFSCNKLRSLVPQVFEGVVRGEGDTLLDCPSEKEGEYCICKESANPGTQNTTIYDLEEKFGEFESIVIDCEGCYKSFFPDIISSGIRHIEIEWDGIFLEDALIRSGFTLSAVYNHPFLEKGVRVYDR
jgi:hypothetical protein